MSRFDDIVNNIRNLDQWEILRETLDTPQVKQLIIDLNTKKQLGLGLDSSGDIFGLYGSFTYASMKQGLPGRKASFGVVDLRLTGDYWGTFRVRIESNGDITIDSNPIKGESNLIEIYGPGIEGLTAESICILVERIIDNYAKNSKEAILQ